MHYYSLCSYYLIYFIMIGASTFVPKYFGEIGMSNSQIGLLTSIPTLIAMAASPVLGLMTDRVPKKRYLLSAMLFFMAIFCFIIPYSQGFAAILASVTCFTIFSTSGGPIGNTIALEYSQQISRPFGPIRLLGTVGFQLGALLVGLILTDSLKNLYPLMGVILVLTFVITFAMPNIQGHQHHQKKVPLSKLFADRHVKMLFIVIFCATISSQFYASFYTKHLGDLGMSNRATSIITLISVLAELPFLYFGDRIARKNNIWNWLLIGMAANGVRWLGLAFSKTAALNILFQIPCVTVLACFEFFPALYLSKRVPAELSGSAQNMLSLVSYGAAKVFATFLGGLFSDWVGIPALFAFNGIMLLLGCLVLWKPTRKLIQEEKIPTSN